VSVFTLSQAAKEESLLKEVSNLVEHHRAACPPYARILSASRYAGADSIAELPWLPVRRSAAELAPALPAGR